jgi:hypothetical protein
MVAQSSAADQADIPAESGSFRVSDSPGRKREAGSAK